MAEHYSKSNAQQWAEIDGDNLGESQPLQYVMQRQQQGYKSGLWWLADSFSYTIVWGTFDKLHLPGEQATTFAIRYSTLEEYAGAIGVWAQMPAFASIPELKPHSGSVVAETTLPSLEASTVTKPEAHNNTAFSLEQLEALPILGTTINNWRQRHITLRQHPTDPSRLISVGVTFNGRMTVYADELRSEWATALDYIAQGKVYISY